MKKSLKTLILVFAGNTIFVAAIVAILYYVLKPYFFELKGKVETQIDLAKDKIEEIKKEIPFINLDDSLTQKQIEARIEEIAELRGKTDDPILLEQLKDEHNKLVDKWEVLEKERQEKESVALP